jgi:galactitol-specific phosphotransferase system IIB component
MEPKDLKHGDKVTCNIKGQRIDDAKVSINERGSIFICQNIKKGSGTPDKLGYEYSWNIYDKMRISGGKITPFNQQMADVDIAVTNLKVVTEVDTLLAKKVKKVEEGVDKSKIKEKVIQALKTDADYHTIKPPVDLPVFSADLDSNTKDLLKRKAARI